MKENYQHMLKQFYAEKDGRILTDATQMTTGICLKVSVCRGDLVIASAVRYVPDVQAASTKFDEINMSLAMQALVLAGMSNDAVQHSTELEGAHVERKEILEETAAEEVVNDSPAVTDAPTDAEPSVEEIPSVEEPSESEPEADAKPRKRSRRRKASAEVATVQEPVAEADSSEAANAATESSPVADGPSVSIESEPTVEEAPAPAEEAATSAGMDIEMAKKVILVLKPDAPESAKRAMASYIGKELGEVLSARPSYISLIANKAGTANSFVTEDIERACEVLVG